MGVPVSYAAIAIASILLLLPPTLTNGLGAAPSMSGYSPLGDGAGFVALRLLGIVAGLFVAFPVMTGGSVGAMSWARHGLSRSGLVAAFVGAVPGATLAVAGMGAWVVGFGIWDIHAATGIGGGSNSIAVASTVSWSVSTWAIGVAPALVAVGMGVGALGYSAFEGLQGEAETDDEGLADQALPPAPVRGY
jgi:hypothetical protein